MKWILPLSILVFFEMVADILAKNWSLRGGWYLASFSLLGYMLANVFWLFALKNGSGLTKGAIIFSISSAVVATILGVFFYKEDISTIQMIGVFLGLISLIFIFWE
ncbi:MAG: EamA family transporter [Candidatus Paceibacterota bacterium]|jgi:drug/metabolite transporter (DMT)-like permease